MLKQGLEGGKGSVTIAPIRQICSKQTHRKQATMEKGKGKGKRKAKNVKARAEGRYSHRPFVMTELRA